MKFLRENKKKGLALIELVAVLGIFSLIILSMTAIAAAMIKSQRRAFSMQNAQEAGRYLLESMSKEIRMSMINSSAGDGLTTLDITNGEGEAVTYRFNNSSKVLLRQGLNISPANIELTGNFYLRKEVFPRRAVVTIVMQAKTRGTVEEQTAIYLQSSVAPRSY